MSRYKIAVFVGSLRKESYNRKMAKALISLAPESLTLEIIEIGGLPLYNQDLDGEGPPETRQCTPTTGPSQPIVFAHRGLPFIGGVRRRSCAGNLNVDHGITSSRRRSIPSRSR